MQRVVILGPGAAGKSTLARRLGDLTGLRVIELDQIFWQTGLEALPRDRWADMQRRLLDEREWILDGDLGPYDVVEIRLRAADTIIFLDFGFVRCAWRAIRRARERRDFWLWLFRYRRHSRPLLMNAMRIHAPTATIHRLRSPKAVRRFLRDVVHRSPAKQAASGITDG